MNWGRVSINTQETAWTQPLLSENGILGGSSFAVSASSEYSSSFQACKLFDGNTATGWAPSENGVSSNPYIIFYNPTPLKVTLLTCTYTSVGPSQRVQGLYVVGSNDNNEWSSKLASWSGDGSGTYSVNVNSTEFYKYHKIIITDANLGNRPGLNEITISATQLTYVLNSITFPYSHYSSDSYAPYIFLYGGGGECYVSSRTSTGMNLYNTSSATSCLYGTIGY